MRKLEFILAEAKRQGCKHVITVGGINSNHCRSTSVACAQAGLECHLILAAGDKVSTFNKSMRILYNVLLN